MFAKLLKQFKALSSADRVLETRGRIISAIETETGKLQSLIAERVVADRNLVDAETAVSLGEEADVNAARKAAERVLVSIQRQGALLGGLRSRLATLTPEMERTRQSVKTELPGHIEKVRADFRAEYDRAAAAFGAVMGKRMELEKLIGAMQLSAPVAVATELPGEITAPWSALRELEESIDQIAGWRNAAGMPLVDEMSGIARQFDESAIYNLITGQYGFSEGTAVMACSFPPGFLQHLVHLGDAVRASAQDWDRALHGAHEAELRIRAEARDEQSRPDPIAACSSAELQRGRDAQVENERHARDAQPAARDRFAVEGSGPK
jgi:hypothetical protein